MPTILLESLENVRRRVRWLGVLFGIGLVLAAAVSLLLATVIIDFLLNLPALPRLVLVILAASTILYALWHWIIKSIFAKLSLTDVAGRVEQTYPQFQDRLRSTVDILTGRNLPGSDVMKQRVVSEATRLTQSLDLNRVVVLRPVWYSTAAGASALLLILLLLGTLPKYSHIALERLFTPFEAHPWPKLVNIDLVGSLPGRVSVGQRLDVAIKLSLGDRPTRKAVIHYQYGDAFGNHFGPEEQEYMTRGDDGIYHASIDAKTPADANAGQMKIWVESGDDRKQLDPVKVVQRLTVTRVDAVVTAPAYANMPPGEANLSQNPVIVTFGSKIRLTATFNKSLDSAHPITVESLTPKSTASFKWDAPRGNVITALMDATDSIRFHLHATDTDGLMNTAAEEYEITVRPDQNPTVMIDNPRRNEDRTPQAVIPLQVLADDDFGITTASLIVNRVGDKKHWEIPLVQNSAAVAPAQWTRVDPNTGNSSDVLLHFKAGYSWDLSALKSDTKDAALRPGDVLEYYVQVKDNYEYHGTGHAPVASGKLRLTIISQEELTNKIINELSTVAEQVTTIKQTQGTTQKQTAGLAKEVQGKPALDNADKAASDRLAAQQSTVASQTLSVAGKLADIQQEMVENKSANQDLKDTARDVGSLLTSAAESPMKHAADDISAAKPAAKDDRDQKLADAQNHQAQAGDTLQKALDRMGNIGSLSRSIEKIRSILEDQNKLSTATAELGKNNLGKSPDQMSKEDQDKLKSLAKAQSDLGDRTQKAMQEMQKDSDKLAKSDPAASKAMSQAADTGQQQDVPGNQKKASAATDQNQQSQAQSGQKQAELGLQMMLADLREAEKHKLDELARKLAELQQQVAILIRRQAGHNMDNLSLQGGDVITKLSETVKLQLFTLSERDPKAPPPAIGDITMLSSAQEQTERNARDIAQASQALPEGGEAADHITQAADKMDRAIVNLRDNKLAEAYNPAQVDALSALLQAKKLIDDQKKKVDDKQDDQKKEAVRQAFMAIRAHQDEVDAKTLAVDSAPRNDDGTMRREELVRLGQLPGEQGKVAAEAQKLDASLEGLGSIVYTWTNRDIVKNMKQVKDLLGGAQTGAPTQTEQKQIIAEIDAMIRDLTTKPEDSKFVQKNNGGGGGGSGSNNMPTEAELRLMKDLQIAENDATATINKQQPTPKADTLALGTRQGDLRNLLDQLIQKASGGKAKLPAEPDNRDQLPEEASGDPNKAAEKVDDAELDQDLLGGDNNAGKKPAPDAAQSDHDLALVGDRMARSRQRLAINNDPGAVTQEIQKRILDNLDDLIEQARKKQGQGQNQAPKPGDGQKQGEPKPSDAKPQDAAGKQQKAGKGLAAGNNPGGGGAAPGETPADIARQEARMWGNVTPRERQAIMETRGETTLDKYKTLVDDYYRTMSAKPKQ
jgi:hypothetical protein